MPHFYTPWKRLWDKKWLTGVKRINGIYVIPAGNYMFKGNNTNTTKTCKICSKLTIQTAGVFIVNFEHISHFFLVLLLLT